jgi:hypothetical protein
MRSWFQALAHYVEGDERSLIYGALALAGSLILLTLYHLFG